MDGELAYWAAQSGLTPAEDYSLADHMVAAGVDPIPKFEYWAGLSGLAPAASYSLSDHKAVAILGGGEPPPDTTGPTPGTLSAENITQTAFRLRVEGASDPSGLHEFAYRFSTNDGASWSAWRLASVYDVSDLTAGTAYTCKHQVRDTLENITTGEAIVVETPVSPTVFSDDFNRADTTSGFGTSSSGHVWETPLGTFGILSNQGRCVATNDGLTVLNTGYTDISISMDAKIVANSYGPQPVGRYEDLNNYYWLEFGGLNGELIIKRRLSGATTTLATSAAAVFTYDVLTAFRFEIEEVGGTTELRVFVNDVEVVSFTDSAADRPNGVRAGLRGGVAGSGSRVDNFSASEL